MDNNPEHDRDDTKDAELTAPFQLRGNFVTAMVLRLLDPDHPDFIRLLSERIGQAPNFYRHAPLVLDLKDMALTGRVVNFETMITALRNTGMIPVGVQNGTSDQHNAAIAAGLAVAPHGRSGALDDPRMAPPPAPHHPAPTLPLVPPAQLGRHRASRLVEEPVRSGQVIYAHDSDLIVMAAVSSGAELLADGHIHVYGPLRGRALAGVGGDTDARIFCRSLEAELVSVAGLYKLSDDFEPTVWKHAVHISLSGSTLSIAPLI